MASKKIVWLGILLLGLTVSIQIKAQQDTNFYRIKFTDKLNTPFDIQNPSDFLSEKAITRRAQQGILIHENDLPIDPTFVSNILSYNSVEYVTHSKWFNQLVITSNDTNDINDILTLPFVESGEQFLKPLSLNKRKEGKLELPKQKTSIVVNPHYPYGQTYEQNHLHRVDFMHDLGFNGQGIDIAVIDAGFENIESLNGLSHLFSSGQILSTYDFVDLEESINEDHYHGSAVLSVMAGNIEGQFYGTAISANYHLLRSEDAHAEYIIEEDFWVRAAEYADSAGCKIINTSLGYTTFDDSLQNHTYSEMDGNTTLIAQACDLASSKGILCVVSAGNLGESDWGHISTPADADSALTIGAVHIFDELAPFSSYGPSADNELKPNLVSVGWMTTLIAPWDNQIIQGNGTSFSAPMVSGLAACLWQALPEMTNMEIKDLLEASANQFESPDTLKGYGYPNIFDAYNSITGITHKDPSEIQIQGIYPNPVSSNESLSLKVASETDTDIKILVIDVTGRVVREYTSTLKTGINLISCSPRFDIASGAYSIVIQNDNHLSTKRLIID